MGLALLKLTDLSRERQTTVNRGFISGHPADKKPRDFPQFFAEFFASIILQPTKKSLEVIKTVAGNLKFVESHLDAYREAVKKETDRAEGLPISLIIGRLCRFAAGSATPREGGDIPPGAFGPNPRPQHRSPPAGRRPGRPAESRRASRRGDRLTLARPNPKGAGHARLP